MENPFHSREWKHKALAAAWPVSYHSTEWPAPAKRDRKRYWGWVCSQTNTRDYALSILKHLKCICWQNSGKANSVSRIFYFARGGKSRNIIKGWGSLLHTTIFSASRGRILKIKAEFFSFWSLRRDGHSAVQVVDVNIFFPEHQVSFRRLVGRQCPASILKDCTKWLK